MDLNNMDKEKRCVDCDDKFWLTQGEQDFYRNKGYQEPKRCKNCREKKKLRNQS